MGGTFSDIASKSRLLNQLSAPSFLPHWDSVRENPREIYQGVKLLEPEYNLFCFNPFLGGPGDPPKPQSVS